MRPWLLAALGLGVYALGLVATAPASLIDASLRQATEGRIRLAEASGSVWSGKGELEVRDANRRSGIAKEIGWRILPLYLLRGELRCEIALDHAPKRFPLAVSAGRIEVADADISLPAAALGLGVPKLGPLELGGDVQLHVAQLKLAAGSIQGKATLQWRSARSAFTQVAPLGDYELDLEGDGTRIRASLRTLAGPLQLSGQGSWAPRENPVFQGMAGVPPEHLQQLAPLLRMIAIERSQGNFELQLR